MDIRKSRDNFDENRKPRCFNCNVYEYMAKECRKPKKNKEMRKCYKCNKVRYLAKDCKLKQKIKIRRNQDESDESDNDNDKKESFIKGLEQAQYNESLYTVIPKIDILFQTDETKKQGN